ncbi:MAG: hypothetical protein KGD60_11870 [Candidatus Thorarchaeota archaeon]|nr:hypothetical protein [Candidatus Thorarchaeota archaeon]
MLLNSEDPRGALDRGPYSWNEVKGEVRIYWNGTLVTTLRKESAVRFQTKISQANPKETQLIMAKVTGNFKRGNEK